MKPVVTYEVYAPKSLTEKCTDCDGDANVKCTFPDGTVEYRCMSGWLNYLNEAALQAWMVVEALNAELPTRKSN